MPIFEITSAINSPIFSSPAEIVATSATFLSSPAIFSETLSISATISAPAFSIPRLSSIGFTPAAINLFASFNILYVSTVTVVVPSPATLFNFCAAVLINFAPTASPNLSSLLVSSTASATVTPSCVITGAPYSFSIMTFLPFGPKVTFTASYNCFAPDSTFSRASAS